MKKVLQKLFKERRPNKLQTDKGSEFFNRHVKQLMKEEGIHLFATENETKASVVERFNRTFERKDVEILYGKEYVEIYRYIAAVGR